MSLELGQEVPEEKVRVSERWLGDPEIPTLSRNLARLLVAGCEEKTSAQPSKKDYEGLVYQTQLGLLGSLIGHLLLLLTEREYELALESIESFETPLERAEQVEVVIEASTSFHRLLVLNLADNLKERLVDLQLEAQNPAELEQQIRSYAELLTGAYKDINRLVSGALSQMSDESDEE